MVFAVPQSFATRVCAGFAQLGARGVTLTFSSGDHGVGDGNPNPATQKCFTNDGRNVTRFIPTFPAGYVNWLLLNSLPDLPPIPVAAAPCAFDDGDYEMASPILI